MGVWSAEDVKIFGTDGQLRSLIESVHVRWAVPIRGLDPKKDAYADCVEGKRSKGCGLEGCDSHLVWDSIMAAEVPTGPSRVLGPVYVVLSADSSLTRSVLLNDVRRLCEVRGLHYIFHSTWEDDYGDRTSRYLSPKFPNGKRVRRYIKRL